MKYYCNIIPNCALKKIESEAPTAKAEDSQAFLKVEKGYKKIK
jgi:hypothetical protein